MAGVNANWDELLLAASRLISNANQLESVVNAINRDVLGTRGAWKGQASEKYQEQWARQIGGFKSAAKNTETMGKQIQNYVQGQIQVENAAKKGMEG